MLLRKRARTNDIERGGCACLQREKVYGPPSLPPAPPAPPAPPPPPGPGPVVTATPYAETADCVLLTDADMVPPLPPAPLPPTVPVVVVVLDDVELVEVVLLLHETADPVTVTRPRSTAAAARGIDPSMRRSCAPQYGHSSSLDRA